MDKIQELEDENRALRAEVEGYRAMLAEADGVDIRVGERDTLRLWRNKAIFHRKPNKWWLYGDENGGYYDTALEAYAAIKPNAAAGESGEE